MDPSTTADDHDPAATADGQLVQAGSFRLDRGRAVDKLAHFQLDDPRRYVAELLAAAVCSGATGVHVRNDADDFEIEWDGDHPTKDELDQLFDHIFYRGDDRRQRMLQHLAQGLFGAAGLDPRWVRLLRPGLTVELTDPAAPKHAENNRKHGVRVEVRERFSWEVLREWSRKPFRAPEELALLRRVAVGCPLPVFVDGQELDLSIAQVVGTPETPPETVRMDSGEEGAVWLVEGDTPAAAGIAVLRDGILVDRIPMPVGPLALCGWVRSDGVRLDASQAGVVRRDHWLEVEQALLGAARRALAVSLGSEAADAVSPLPRADRQQAGRKLLQGPDCVLATVPLFQGLDGHHWSLRQLVEVETVLCAQDPSLADPGLELPQLFGDETTVRRLRRLGIPAKNGAPQLSRRREGRRRRAQLRAGHHPMAVPAVVRSQRSSETGRMSAGLGLLPELTAAESSPLGPLPDESAIYIELRVEGLPLERVRRDGPGPVLVRVEDERLRADDGFTEVRRDAVLDALLEAAEAFATELLEQALAPQHLQHAAVRPVLWRWVRYELRGSRKTRPRDLPRKLRDAPLFACLDGRHRSITELAEQSRALGRVDKRKRTVVWTVPAGSVSPGPVPAVAVVDDDESHVLRRIFNGRAPDMLAHIRDEAAAAARKQQGKAEAVLQGPVLGRRTVDLPRERLRGELGLRPQSLAPARAFVVREKVMLGSVELPLDLPGAEAVVAWEQAEPLPDWSGLADPEGTALALGGLLERMLLDTAREQATEHMGSPAHLQAPLPPWLAALLAQGPQAAAELASLPFVRDAAGTVRSLGDLLEHTGGRRSQWIERVPPQRRLPSRLPGVEAASEQLEEVLQKVIIADDARAEILESWLGSKAVRDGCARLDALEQRWRDHAATPALPWALPNGTLGRVAVSGPGFEALLGLDPAGTDGLTLLLRHQDRPLAELRRTASLPWIAVVRGPAIVPTAQLDGLHDDRVARTLHEHLRDHRRAVLDQLAELPDTHRLRQLLRRVLAAVVAKRVRGVGETAPLRAALEDRPLLEDAEGALHTLQQARQAHARGALSTVGVLPEGVTIPQDQLWLRFSRETLDLLRLALKATPPSADRLAARMRQGLERRASLRAESLAPSGSYALSGSRETGGGEVWVGITAEGPARRVWMVERRPVHTELLKGRQGVLLRIAHPELRANEAFDRAEPAALVRRMAEAAEEVLDTVLSRGGAQVAGRPRRPEDPAVRDPQLVVDAILRHFAGRTTLPAELAEAPLLPVSHGPPRTLAVLQRTPVRVAEPGTRGRPLDPDHPVILADDARRRLLGAWGRVEDATAALADEAAAWARREAPPQPLPRAAETAVQVPIEGPREGSLWLEPERSGLAVFHRGRALGSLPVPGPLPLAGAVEDPALQPDPWFRKPVEDAALQALMDAVEAAAERALHALLDLPEPPAEALLQTALRVFRGVRELRRATSSKGTGLRARLARQVELETGTGARLSLGALSLLQGGPRWIGPTTTVESLDEERPFVRAPADAPTRAALRRLLGGTDAEAEARREAAAAARMAAPVLPLEIDGDGIIARASGAEAGMRWVAALVSPIDRRWPVSLRIAGREVARLSGELPGLRAVVDLPEQSRDPYWERDRLTRDQERALHRAREALVREAGAQAIASAHDCSRLVTMLAAEPKLCRRVATKGALPKRSHPTRAWLEAPLLQGLHGAVSLAELARAEQRFWVPPEGVPENIDSSAFFVHFSPAADALAEVLGLPLKSWTGWQQELARAEVRAEVEARLEAEAEARRERSKELKRVLARLLQGIEGTRQLQKDALEGISEAELDAAETPGARLALAWTRADAVLVARDSSADVGMLVDRLARLIRDRGMG